MTGLKLNVRVLLVFISKHSLTTGAIYIVHSFIQRMSLDNNNIYSLSHRANILTHINRFYLFLFWSLLCLFLACVFVIHVYSFVIHVCLNPVLLFCLVSIFSLIVITTTKKQHKQKVT